MSASLDDMPAYEHFQDELDHELTRYAKKYSLLDVHFENQFIEYICFLLFLNNPRQLSSEILEHFFHECPQSITVVKSFIMYLNNDDESYLKNTFANNLNLNVNN